MRIINVWLFDWLIDRLIGRSIVYFNTVIFKLYSWMPSSIITANNEDRIPSLVFPVIIQVSYNTFQLAWSTPDHAVTKSQRQWIFAIANIICRRNSSSSSTCVTKLRVYHYLTDRAGNCISFVNAWPSVRSSSLLVVTLSGEDSRADINSRSIVASRNASYASRYRVLPGL